MNITDVRVRKISKEGKMKAVVSVTIDDEFVVQTVSTGMSHIQSTPRQENGYRR